MAEEWVKRYSELLDKIPESGTILTSIDNAPSPFRVSLTDGERALIYGIAYVPDIYNFEPLKWYLSKEKESNGLKCILLPRDRARLFREWLKLKDENATLMVKSFTVLRVSSTGLSLLGEAIV